MLTVYLSHRPNPDVPNGYWAPAPTPAATHADVSTLAEASRACLSYISASGIGAGNWTGGAVIDASGTVIAQVSYNGRVC